MLTRDFTATPRMKSCGRQTGVVLVIALVVLVAMTLAAVALVRSVDTSNVIAGNLAFQQAAVNSADTGIEDAITWLNGNNTGTTLDADDATHGYAANGSDASHSPAAGQSWDAFWGLSMAGRAYSFTAANSLDAAGNSVQYVIDRLCRFPGAKTAGASCIASPVVHSATGNAEEAGEIQLNAPSVVYYRITARVNGPRNTVTYVQAVVSL
jgi:type IV pilus assembly protein PilX